ncbi:hypothetical protein FIBSPDRAFT_741759 [Athelia psychrophila]|uniref:SRR1-like domain-containing protein n=1 Tax=Athelia psychrophila TaxID=1759441 RepID=A0A166JHR5_9AGAM|nr:hypothetical protein FIBSPDRAFT_741759 [Fibularhizoctonia sp. CBS 109695]
MLSSSYLYTDFKRVGPQKKRKSKAGLEAPSISALYQRAVDDLTTDSNWLTNCQQMLCDTLKDALMESPTVLCLGLGSPTGSRDARIQLAFLLAACHELDIDHNAISIYDPVFTVEDSSFLTSLRIHCMTENLAPQYTLVNPTILYMPHCDRILYENILRKNWSGDGMRRILLVANCLGDYVDSIPSRKLASESPCLSKIVPYLRCRMLPTLQCCTTAFSSMAIQYIEKDALATLDRTSSFWELPSGKGQQDEETKDSCTL